MIKWVCWKNTVSNRIKIFASCRKGTGLFLCCLPDICTKRNQRLSLVPFFVPSRRKRYVLWSERKRKKNCKIEERGLTQEQLAEKLNISTSNLGKLERGLQGLSIDLLVEIRCFFGVSTDYILFGEEIQRQEVIADIDSVIAKMVALKRKVWKTAVRRWEIHRKRS